MEKKERILKEIGKVFVNFGNLIFASLVLGTIIRGDYSRMVMLLIGGGLVLVLVTFGIILLSRREEK